MINLRKLKRRQLSTVIFVIILVLAIPATLYLARQTQIIKSRAAFLPYAAFMDNSGTLVTTTNSRNTRLLISTQQLAVPQSSPTPTPTPVPTPPIDPTAPVDTLNYFLTKHPDQGLDGAHQTGSLTDFINGHALSQTIAGNTAYYTKWASNVFEEYTWDQNNIYLREDYNDASDGAAYDFTNGIWLKRSMKPGDVVTSTDNQIKKYAPGCSLTSTSQFPIEMTFEQHDPSFNLGGDLGVQDVIIIKYDSAVGLQTGFFERFYYSSSWGWVRWEQYDKASGNLVSRRTFNKMANPISPNTSLVCNVG